MRSKLTGKKKQVIAYLRNAGEKGATVFEMIQNHCGSDARKRISELRRMGYNIESKDEGGHSRYWLREKGFNWSNEHTDSKGNNYHVYFVGNTAFRCTCSTPGLH